MWKEKKYKEIEKIKWFSRCGKNIPNNIGFYFFVIDNWKDAIESNFKDNWQDINMKENSDLTNIIGDEADYDENYELYSTFFTNRILPLIQEYTIIKNIDFSISSNIRNVVINSLFENKYKDKYEFPMIYTKLLNVYKKGHFPCGWDGNYPDGNLLIY